MFEGSIALQFRAYDTGVAYRFVTDLPGEMEIEDELIELKFTSNCQTFFPKEDSFQSHYERDYLRPQLADISSDQFCSLARAAAKRITGLRGGNRCRSL